MSISKPNLYLCKPNRTKIADLSAQAYGIVRNLKLGNISELKFNIPVFIEKNHKLERNNIIDLIRYRYLIKFEENDEEEWYVIRNSISNATETIDEFVIECFSLPYELNNFVIRSYFVESKTLSQIANDLLKNTNWSLGYVNADFDIKFRSYEVTEDKVLGAILELATVFDAIIKWDTENRKINFYKSEQIGSYKGLNFQYGKYLKSLNQSLELENFCTRLKIYGQDGLSINEYNITGTDYLDDFSYYLYPYEENENGNVIRSSNYMSDELCHAILQYNKLLAEKDGEFSNYIAQLDIYNGELLVLQNELVELENELNIILDNLDIAESNNQNTSELYQQKISKEIEIENKKKEINNKQNQINSVKKSINELGELLNLENNFTPELLFELTDYIEEKTIENHYIFDAKELLEWGKEQFKKINIPQILIDINTINIDQYLDENCQVDKGKLKLGDVVRINHELFTIDVMAKIIEMEINYEDGEINLIISNIESINKEEDKFIKRINEAISTSTQVNLNKYKWNNAAWNLDEVSQILNNAWDAGKRIINSGVNNSVVIDRRGITVYSLDNPDKMVRIVGGCIGVTNTGERTFYQLIDGDGIYGERIIGRIVASNRLIITNTEGTFEVNETGVTLDGLALTIKGGLPVSQLAEGVLLENNFYNGVKIDSLEGLVVTRNDNKIRSVLNATDGISIEKWENSQWVKKLHADNDGNLIIKGFIEIGSGSSIFKADNNGIYLGSNNFNYAPFKVSLNGNLTATSANIQGNIDCSSLKIGGIDILDSLFRIKGEFLADNSIGANKLKVNELIVGENIQMGANAYISWNNVYNKPTDLAYKSDIPTLPSYIKSTYIDSTTIQSPTIVGGSIISNTTINVGTDASIGRYLNMSTIHQNGAIRWQGYGEIFMDLPAKTLVVYGDNATQIGTWYGNTIIRGNVSFPDSSGIIAVFG